MSFQSLLASFRKKAMEKVDLKFIDTASKFGHVIRFRISWQGYFPCFSSFRFS
jgi:hypothetical protein